MRINGARRTVLARATAAAVTCGLLVLGSAGAASAASTESKVSGIAANGVSYTARSSLTVKEGTAWSHAKISTVSGSVASGWMATNGRLLNSAGQLVSEGGYIYNDGPASGMSTPSNSTRTKGVYYGKGTVKAWNGNGYNAHYTFQTPSLNV